MGLVRTVLVYFLASETHADTSVFLFIVCVSHLFFFFLRRDPVYFLYTDGPGTLWGLALLNVTVIVSGFNVVHYINVCIY